MNLSNQDDFNLAYLGQFDDKITNLLIDLSSNQASNLQSGKSNRKISFLIAECFQNVIRHSDNLEKIENNDFFLLNKSGNAFHIFSINLVKREKVQKIENAILTINELDKDELKKMYLKELENSEISDKGGAGLGLIEIARKTNNKLIFDFTESESGDYLFHFLTTLNLSNEDEENTTNELIFNFKKIYSKMLTKNTLFFYKGDFKQNTILPILSIVEANYLPSNFSKSNSKKMYLVAIEALQNISRHSLEKENKKEGTFTIKEHDNNLVIEFSNLVSGSIKPELENEFNYLISLDEESLGDLYKKRLKTTLPSNQISSKVGLIEIIKNAGKNNIKFDFKSSENEDNNFIYNLAVSFSMN
jgi:hypothetical protein